MKQPRKYRRRAEHYRVLAKGYSALKSNLAVSAEGAAEVFEDMARVTDAVEAGQMEQADSAGEGNDPRHAVHELQD
jgi:hypothetical protein